MTSPAFDEPAISAVIASASVIIGVIIAILQLRDVARTRHTELIVQLNPTLNE